ncbi:hypothetical protein L226DRAFT_39114 [Lentinus tigrinus ALCF2SS1-7]|uniref:uncharacterized protein n=1 Tax=Lentinus tigrinus ALCF2SS1-7 TaxID=1328758 RepID=UPI00116632A4|nr:hypothetical protein L226DRAFT_39114 [Lentinus tigrinus ALCF2SS1-7]
MMDAFVKLHPFSVAMGVIGWLLSMSRRSVLKWRTKTIMHMPNPEWAFIPAAVGFISTVILSVCYLLLQLGPNEVNAFKIDFKLFDIVAKLEINPGNARKYDHAAAICFGLALFFYLISVHTPLLPVRWQGRREEVVPIVQLEELPPFRLALRHIQRRKQGQSQDLELPKASSTHLNTEQYELSGYSPSSPPTPYTRDMQIIPSQRNHT